MGVNGVVCFGMGFGLLVAVNQGLSRRAARVSCKAAFEQPGGIVLKEQDTDISKPLGEQRPAAMGPSQWEMMGDTSGHQLHPLCAPLQGRIAYLQDVPRTIIEADTLEKLLKDSYLYTLKTFAEVYGPGKATKMGWWDYFRLKVDLPDTAELQDEEDAEYVSEYFRLMMEGKVPFAVPGPAGYWYTGAIIQWKGKEPFAGDQVQTLLENGRWSKQYLSNLAFYREAGTMALSGLKPWQRGLEIGMAHGYFLSLGGQGWIGPFTSLGPLRNTPEAATVGLLCGCAIVGIVSVGGLIFGSTIKPTRFDKPGDKPAAGFIEMINWHAIGGLGGAGFAHALITIFGS
eukprot:Skav235202  [mRNA]  locus=scaffold4495:16402:24522:- [translate_table: standard]